MVDVTKLKMSLIKNGLTLTKLAHEINMNPSTLFRKLANNGDTFTLAEAFLIKQTLNMSDNEAHEIFFAK